MNITGISRTLAAAALGAALVALPAAAQQMKTVGGIVVNIGIISAIAAEHADAQHGVHKGGHGSGMEHLVVSLAEQKGGARIGDADVSIEVKNPKGAVQKKPALPMMTGGYPDYSEVFDFGWSGSYVVRVSIKRKAAAKPVEAVFTVNRVI
ncbi:MAG TPA: hypothetical protein VFR66_05960 [Burkholderiales bacterium]|nr:hypothetical protein [Burkholderiales bacterium]